MRERTEIIRLAEEHVYTTVAKNLSEALAKVNRLRDPEQEACRCRNCLVGAVSDLNSWVIWTAEGNCDPEMFKHHVVSNKDGLYILNAQEYQSYIEGQ